MLQLTQDEKHTSYIPLIIKHILEGGDNDSSVDDTKKKRVGPSEKEVILAVLTRAANDPEFLARLSEDPSETLSEYDLTLEEKAALESGDIRRIESWIDKLDTQSRTWVTCRLQQEQW